MLKVAIFMYSLGLAHPAPSIGDHMSKLHAAILACAIGLCGPAFAQTPTADQRGACGADSQKYCVGTQPGGGRVVACLNQHRDQLGAACKKAIDSRKK
jgi:hypothetical protein